MLIRLHIAITKQYRCQGKIVLCVIGGGVTSVAKGQTVKAAGGVPMILMNIMQDGITTSADAHLILATDVTYADGQKILAYINLTSNPLATITIQGTIIGDKNTPVVATFSSRGPSRATPGILKLDIIGPGVNILVAWPTSMEKNTKQKNTFNIISGTSMSCPHLGAVTALLKSAHADWSPAAIKAAIMTTADIVNLIDDTQDENQEPANLFAIGAGHVNPPKANHPGLVYDIQPGDYVPYLCGLNCTNPEVGVIVQQKVNCSEIGSIQDAQLNYPSFSITLGSTPQKYTRIVTNVGEAKSSYTVEVASPRGDNVKVEPSVLNFTE